MGRQREEATVTAALEKYIAGVDDGKKLNIRVAAAAIGYSHETLRKYGLNLRLRAAKKALKPADAQRKRADSVASLKEARDRHRQAASAWEAKYRNLLSRYVKIEYWCRVKHGIDVDALLAQEIPRPDRSQPL